MREALQEASAREAALEERKAGLEAAEALLTVQRDRARAQVEGMGEILSREIGERGAEAAMGVWLRLNAERKGQERVQIVRVQHAAVVERKRIKTFLLTSIHEWVHPEPETPNPEEIRNSEPQTLFRSESRPRMDGSTPNPSSSLRSN